MSFSELIKLLREFREEMRAVKEEYYKEIRPLLRELIDEIRKLREAMERCRTT